MKNHFVPYELAVKLKELGFDEECLASYYHAGRHLDICEYITHGESTTLAPLWQQAFDFFMEKGLHVSIGLKIDNEGYTFLITNIGSIPKVDYLTFPDKFDFVTYESVRIACLEKLIEIISK